MKYISITEIDGNRNAVRDAFKAYLDHVFTCSQCGAGDRRARCDNGYELQQFAGRMDAQSRTYEFTGHDDSQRGKRLESAGACCTNSKLHNETDPFYGEVSYCENCGTKTKKEMIGGHEFITIVQGKSVRCPNWTGHHFGSTCEVCGQK